MNKKIAIAIISLLLVLLIIPSISAASPIGASSITLNHSSGTAGIGGSVSTGYTVKLISGSTWGTTIAATAHSGITVTFSNSGGDPTYSGTMTVTVSKTVSPGTYNIFINATGDDPSSSPAVYKLTVTNSTVTSPVPPPKIVTNNLPFEIGGAIIAVSLILAIIPAVLPALVQAIDRNRAYALLVVSVIALGPSIYLAVDNPLLRTAAPLHYGLLILYIILLITALVMVFKNKTKNYSMYLFRILGGGMFALMLVDIVIGLPLSSTYAAVPYIGWKYLFGFGTTSISSFGLSLAFSIIMIASALLFSFSIKNTKVSKKNTVKTVK